MNHRILKGILKPIKESLDNREPKPIERENLQISKSSLIIARAALIITIVLGIIGTGIAWWYGGLTAKLAKAQIQLQKEQNKTSLDIQHFDSLLYKIDTVVKLSTIQVDTLVSLNKTLNEQVDVLIEMHNLNVVDFNMKNQKMLLEKANAYNDIASAMNEIEPIINIFRAARDNHLVIQIVNVKQRLDILDTVNSKLNILKSSTYLMPFGMPTEVLSAMLDSCYNGIGKYKSDCLYNISRGRGYIDSSYIGQKMFADVINSYLDLEDSIGAHLDENRERTIRNLREVEKAIDSKNRILDKRKAKHK